MKIAPLLTALALAAPLAASAPTHKEKKIMQASAALLKSLETGNPSLAEKLLSKKAYVQHNLLVPDGREALLGILPTLAEAGTKVRTVRSFKDGDYVVHHSDYFLFGKPRVGFDVFRYEDGRIVEHWDNLQETEGPNPSGHTMIDGVTEVRDLERTEANKALVRGLIDDIFLAHRYEKLPEYVSSAGYIQHNPRIGDGLAGLQQAGAHLARFAYEDVVKVLGQGNFVLTMSRIKFDGQDAAVYDLFRVEDGRIVEHWDVLEMIPPRNAWKHANGKF